MEDLNIAAKKREIKGKKTKSLRREGILPAVVFSAGEDSQNVQISSKEFSKIYDKAGHSTLVDVDLEGNKFKILIEEVQINPRNRAFEHVMLKKVNLKEEITAEIPVEIVGEAPAVKIEKAVVVTPVAAIEIRCLPTDLPQKFELDISSLSAIGDSLTVADLKLPKGVSLVHDEDIELTLITMAPPQKEEVEEVTVAPEDVEVISKGKEEATDQATQSEDSTKE